MTLVHMNPVTSGARGVTPPRWVDLRVRQAGQVGYL
jgi:hypothetical protein